MFFDQDHLQARLLDVLALDQKNSVSYNQRNYHALSFRLDADTQLSFRDRTLHAGADTVGYFPAHLLYRRNAVRDRMVVIHFELDRYYSGNIEMYRPIHAAPVRALFEQALQCWQGKEPGYFYQASGFFYQILALIRAEIGAEVLPDIPEQLRPAFEYLNEHFTDPALSVAALAQQCFVSEAYFRKRFRAATGSTPRQFITGKRLSYALSLLESRCLPVEQVALQAGFTDAKYFSTVFKKWAGIAPSRYLYSRSAPEERDALQPEKRR